MLHANQCTGLLVSVSLALLLGGCATEVALQKKREFQRAQLAVGDDCRKKYQDGLLRNWKERTDCMNDGLMRVAVEYDYPFLDLIMFGNAYRSALAEKLDRGEITEVQAKLLQADVGVFGAQEEQRRIQAAMQTQAQMQQARAASTQSLGALIQGFAAYQQATTPQYRSPVTCTVTGNFFHCY